MPMIVAVVVLKGFNLACILLRASDPVFLKWRTQGLREREREREGGGGGGRGEGSPHVKRK